jgi:hypothetical protein
LGTGLGSGRMAHPKGTVVAAAPVAGGVTVGIVGSANGRADWPLAGGKALSSDDWLYPGRTVASKNTRQTANNATTGRNLNFIACDCFEGWLLRLQSIISPATSL